MGSSKSPSQEVLERYRCNSEFLVPILQDVQELQGYLPSETLEEIAERLEVPLTRVFAVATFYKAFSLEPRGEHVIRICDGTACHVGGSDKLSRLLKEEYGLVDGHTNADGLFTLEMAHCLGACAFAPVVVIDDRYYEKVTPAKLRDIISSYGDRT